MKVLLAPDTSDHQNWGCRVMGAAFRGALSVSGAEWAGLALRPGHLSAWPGMDFLRRLRSTHPPAR